MGKWQIILWAAAASYVLRAIPLLATRKLRLTEGGVLSNFLNYAAYSVLGGIIYSALYGDKLYRDWEGHFNYDGLIKLGIVFVAFFVAIKTKSILKTLAICLALYGPFVWFMPWICLLKLPIF